jgi:hypothetical protein
VAAAVGLAAFAAGVAALLAPSLAALVPVDAALAVAGNDYLVVVPLAAAGVAVCLGLVAVVATRGVTEATPPAPEGVPTADPPGADLDRALAGRRSVATRLHPRWRARVHDRLREAAVRTVARTDGCSRAEARARVAEGAWTDDPVAAGFLREPPSPWTEIPGLARGESRFQRGARRTVAALRRRREGAS